MLEISKKDIQRLPWRYQVALAVRSAQRVVPLFRLPKANHREAI
jgi:hypothetical protein